MSEVSTDPLRALVVGTGFGCRIQVPALRGAGFEVAGLVGANAARTADRAAAGAVPAAFTDLAQAIRSTGAKLVAISTPPHTHAELAIAALELGCHVICEKPFARDSEAARAMLNAARKAGTINALGNEFRFVPARAAAAQALAEGRIGEPRLASFLQLMSFVSDFEQDFPDWWFDPAEGGGWLGASGSHLVDQVRSWLGEFESVSAALGNVALTRRSMAGGAVEDSFSVRFRMKSGVEGVLQQSAGSAGPFVEVSRVSGPSGSVWIEGGRAYIADAAGARDLPIDPAFALPPAPSLGGDARQNRTDWKLMAETEIAPYTQLCRVVRAAILGEPSPSPVRLATFADGVANMQVMDAIRASAREGGRLMRVDEV